MMRRRYLSRESAANSTRVESAVAFVDVGGFAYSRKAEMLAPLAGIEFTRGLQCFARSSCRRRFAGHRF